MESDKRQESRYARSLIEASLDPLITISAEGKITDMNDALVNITGMSRVDITGTDFFNYFTEPQKAKKVYEEVFANASVVDSPLTLRHKNGKLTNVLFNGSIYNDFQGNVLGVVIVARDVTEQNRIASELVDAKTFAELATGIAEAAKVKAETATRIAEDAVRAKQQFLSNMSHEIRTPMTAIIGFAKVLLKSEVTTKQNEYLQAIKLSGDAMIVLINDILDLAKVDSGKMVFENIPFKMSVSIAAMMHLFEIKIQEKNIQFVKEIDPNINEVLSGDPVRLHQIILNLLSNAVKFTSAGSILVRVKLLNETDENQTIEFSVIDTGIGIKFEKMDTIFEKFHQATSGTSRLYGGTGLGLAIVKQLVEQQGGKIYVKSEPEKGSVFSFQLTFGKTNAMAEPLADIEELSSELKNIKVLVVEDIALNQLLMKTLLDDFGFERDVAENGRIAIEKLKVNNYDLILMDLQMPEMNGFEAATYIRNEMHSKIPIIALTADVTTADLAKCKLVGMNDYISKPVDERILYNKILSWVKSRDEAFIQSPESNYQINQNRYTDLVYLNKRTKSNPALMIEMITLYLDQTPGLIKEMKESFINKNWTLLNASLHKMIPSFSIMGIHTEFEKMAKKVMAYAKTQEETPSIEELVLILEKVCLRACEELSNEIITIKNKMDGK